MNLIYKQFLFIKVNLLQESACHLEVIWKTKYACVEELKSAKSPAGNECNICNLFHKHLAGMVKKKKYPPAYP